MKTWRNFLVMTAAFILLIWLSTDVSVDDWARPTLILAAFLGFGSLSWFLTRNALWISQEIEPTGISYHPRALNWYRRSLVCALLYGGLVFMCSTDHNIMYESCIIIDPDNQIAAGPANWVSSGRPCRLTSQAYFDLAVGIGVALSVGQIPLIVYWLGWQALWLSKRLRGKSIPTKPNQ